MRHPILLVISVISIGLFETTPAWSAEATGWIASVDFESDTVTLDDGQSFLLPDDIGGTVFTEGARVTITYRPDPRGKLIQCVALVPSRVRPPVHTIENPETRICSLLPPPGGRQSPPVRLENRNFRFPHR